MVANNKLDSLTSLRFFVSLCVILQHYNGFFGFYISHLHLGMVLSYFYVLSGFILSYVYPKLDTFAKVKKFWRARFARIWPAYVASLVLGFILIHYTWDTKRVIANLLMIQSWIPIYTYYFSYNVVAWSVSTEVFCYLAFPLLLFNFEKKWGRILFLSALIVFVMVYISNHYNFLPSATAENANKILINQHWLVSVNPISRIFEFIFGMVVAHFWRNRKSIITSGVSATILELGSILLCLLLGYLSNNFLYKLAPYIGETGQLWLGTCGSFWAFGLLIYVMASGRGYVSKVLSVPFLVFLGELSYGMYLIHQIILYALDQYRSVLFKIPYELILGGYLFTILLSAYILWSCIEMPGRKFLLGGTRIHATSTMVKTWKDYLEIGKKPIIATFLLFCGIISFQSYMNNPLNILINREQAENLTPNKLKDYINTEFANNFVLRGLNVERIKSEIKVKLAWEKNIAKSSEFYNAINVTNQKGEVLAVSNYYQPKAVAKLKQGDIWMEEVVIPIENNDQRATTLTISVVDQSGSLPVQNAKTDADARQLIVNIDNTANG